MDLDFRPLTMADLPRIAAWTATPHVAKWWVDSSDLDSVTRRYAPSIEGSDPTEHFVIRADGHDIGMIQRYFIPDESQWAASLAPTIDVSSAAGLDYFIGEPELIGLGIGSSAIASFAALTIARYPAADRIVVAVSQDNVASWRALEKAGFSREWAGEIDSDDPSDAGPQFVYCLIG